jgi:hypothetical protein
MGRVAAFTLSIALIGMIAPTAVAVEVGNRAYGYSVSWSGGKIGRYDGMWIGSYWTDMGEAFCVTPRGTSPTNGTGSGAWWLDGWSNQEGEQMTTQQLAQAAFLAYSYTQWESNPQNAAIIKLALLSVLGLDNAEVYGANGARANFDVRVPGSDGRIIADQLGLTSVILDWIARAQARASTWNGVTSGTKHNLNEIRYPGDTINYEVNFPGIPAGYDVFWTITKPDGATVSVTTQTNASGTAALEWDTLPDLLGEYKVKWQILNVPPRIPLAFYGPGRPAQLLYIAVPDTGRKEDPDKVSFIHDGELGIETQISDQAAEPGSTITDTVRATGLVPMVYGKSVSWKFTGSIFKTAPDSYGSCQEADWSTGKAEQVHSFTEPVPAASIVDYAVEMTMGSYMIPVMHPATCYTYQVKLHGTYDGMNEDLSVSHELGMTTETTLVRSDLPVVTSAVSNQSANPGETITDTVEITNITLRSGVTWTLTGTLVEAVPVDGACSKVDWGKGTPVKTYETVVTAARVSNKTAILSGLGGYVIPNLQEQMCYSYGATLTVVGADVDVTVEHPVGHPTQTTLSKDGRPTLSSEISTQSANPGETITDTVILTNLWMGTGVTWTVTGILVEAVPVDGACSKVAWGQATQVTSYEMVVQPSQVNTSRTARLTGVGAYAIPVGQTQMCYSYGVTLTGSGSGITTTRYDHPVGHMTQTTLSKDGVPTLSSQVSQQMAMPGDTITDTVRVRNLWITPSVTWVLTTVIAAADPVQGSCAGVNWVTSQTVHTSTTTLTPVMVDANHQVTLPGLGAYRIPYNQPIMCYSYGAVLTASGEGAVPVTVTHAIGDVAQTALAMRDGLIIITETQISNQMANPGETIRDYARAEGLVSEFDGDPMKWVFEGDLHQATADDNGECTDVDWTDTEIVYSWMTKVDNSKIQLYGVVEETMGIYTIPRFEDAHCYSYEVKLTGYLNDEEFLSTYHPVGHITESTLVRSDMPTIVTQISNQKATPGDTISDMVMISNLHFDPVDDAPLSWNMQGILVKAAPVDAGCATVDWTHGKTVHEFSALITEDMLVEDSPNSYTVAGLGAYTIPSGEPEMCYTFGETLIAAWESSDDPDDPSEEPPTTVHPVGHVQQTTLVPSGIKPVATGGTVVTDRNLLLVVVLSSLVMIGGYGIATGIGRIRSHRQRSLPSQR